MIPNPRYPIYIISKGRWASRQTVTALEQRAIPYILVIEPQEYASYAAVINPVNIVTLPFSNLGQGSIPARNWVWDHAVARGATKHWILDDNIQNFFRLHMNQKYPITNGIGFCAIEDLADRYQNVALAGMQYFMFASKRSVYPPLTLNTRIYSCILINHALPYRWRGRYNEDTDLSLRALKDGWCTFLVNAFLIRKAPTMTMSGGNTDELYRNDGRLLMAQSLQQQHPDVVTIVKKWGRWQHHVDYRPFKKNRLILKPDTCIPHGSQNYGLVLRSK